MFELQQHDDMFWRENLVVQLQDEVRSAICYPVNSLYKRVTGRESEGGGDVLFSLLFGSGCVLCMIVTFPAHILILA